MGGERKSRLLGAACCLVSHKPVRSTSQAHPRSPHGSNCHQNITEVWGGDAGEVWGVGLRLRGGGLRTGMWFELRRGGLTQQEPRTSREASFSAPVLLWIGPLVPRWLGRLRLQPVPQRLLELPFTESEEISDHEKPFFKCLTFSGHPSL